MKRANIARRYRQKTKEGLIDLLSIMPRLRAHHIPCLLLPDRDMYLSRARLAYSQKGYKDEYAHEYLKIFDIAHSDPNTRIEILDTPEHDDSCLKCHHYRNGICASPQADTFTEWDKEIINILRLKVGDILEVRDLHTLVRERISPRSMLNCCKSCLYDLTDNCVESLVRSGRNRSFVQ